MKKAALVQLVSGLNPPVPNVVIFQFNPDTLRHSMGHEASPTAAAGNAGSNPLAVAGAPSESFSFTLELDADDSLATPSTTPALPTVPLGLYPRLAALETFVHPIPTDTPAAGRPTPAGVLPTVLFVWNSGRILPVRVTSLTITEKLYDQDLNPIHAEANIELRVLTFAELTSLGGATAALARAAYEYTQAKRVALIAQNLVASEQQLIDMVIHDITSPG